MNIHSKSLTPTNNLTQISFVQRLNARVRIQCFALDIPRSSPKSPPLAISQLKNLTDQFNKTFKDNSKTTNSNKKINYQVPKKTIHRNQQTNKNRGLKKPNSNSLESIVKNFVEIYLDSCRDYPEFAIQRKPLIIELFNELKKINDQLNNQDQLYLCEFLTEKQETILKIASNAYVDKAMIDYIEYLGNKVLGQQSPYALYILLKPLIKALKINLPFDFPCISISSYQIRQYISKLSIYQAILKSPLSFPVMKSRNLLVENKLGGQQPIYPSIKEVSGSSQLTYQLDYQIGTVKKLFLSRQETKEIDDEIKQKMKKPSRIKLHIDI